MAAKIPFVPERKIKPTISTTIIMAINKLLYWLFIKLLLSLTYTDGMPVNSILQCSFGLSSMNRFIFAVNTSSSLLSTDANFDWIIPLDRSLFTSWGITSCPSSRNHNCSIFALSSGIFLPSPMASFICSIKSATDCVISIFGSSFMKCSVLIIIFSTSGLCISPSKTTNTGNEPPNFFCITSSATLVGLSFLK